MSVRQMISYHSLLLLYKSKQTKKPVYIFSKINSKFLKRTRLATTEGIKDSRNFKSSLAQASFIPRTIKTWNEDLPIELRSDSTLERFKFNLKTWIKGNIKL